MVILFLDRYVKKSDSLRTFRGAQYTAAVFAFLALVVDPFLFWFLCDSLIQGQAITSAQSAPLPFFLAFNFPIACALAAGGLYVVWLSLSNIPLRTFEKNMRQFAHLGDNDLIDMPAIFRKVWLSFFAIFIAMAVLGMVYLYVTIIQTNLYLELQNPLGF